MTAGMVAVPVIMPLKAPGGSRKADVDTSTLIALHSDTKDSVLFYTVDGSKPDPFKKLGGSATFQYSKPFQLKPGKHTIRAVAVLRDGSKESSVNTKVFQVKFAVPSDSENMSDELLQRLKEEKQGSGPSSSDRATTSPLFRTVIRSQPGDPEILASQDVVKKVVGVVSDDETVYSRTAPTSPPRSSVRAGKSGGSGDAFDMVVSCLKCLAPRPSDPYARFCSACGAHLPPAPGCYRTSGGIGKCPDCGAKVPMNTRYCILCEKSLPDSPSVEKHPVKAAVCEKCGTVNPPASKICLVCEHRLLSVSVAAPAGAHLKAESLGTEFVMCPTCKRVNSGDARFCDWCSARLHFSTSLQCQSCTTNNEVHSRYCCSCGLPLRAPPRKQFQKSLLNPMPGEEVSLLATFLDGDARWISLPSARSPKIQAKHVSTQTDGLFYSSSASMERDLAKNNGVANVPDAMLKRGFPNKAVSPGKGYWRQQVDHINHQLKVYAHNNLDFRQSISNLRIAKLVTALAQEEMDGQELTITVNFALKNDKKDGFAGAAKKLATTLNAFSTSAKSTKEVDESLNSDLVENGVKQAKPKAKLMKTATGSNLSGSLKLHKLSPESKQLLGMLKSSDHPDLDKMDEVVTDGADVNATDENGLPFLKLAVMNKHFDAMQLLIDRGAEVDRLSGVRNSSALHEAVLLGLSGTKAIEVLLQNEASVDIKNAKGESPYDVAVAMGIDAITSMFADKAGHDLLKEVSKLT